MKKITALDCLLFVYLFGIIVLGFVIYNHFISNEEHNSTISIEKEIDSIKTENNKLLIEVNNLDSIKNVKTIEIKVLDNDSTLKLFYKLIRQ